MLSALATCIMGLLIGWAPTASAELRCDADRIIVTNLPALRVSANTPVNTVLWSASGVSFSAACGRKEVVGSSEQAFFYRQPLDLGNGLSLYLTYNADRGNTFQGFNTRVNVSNWYVVGIRGTTVAVTADLQLVKTGTTPTSGSFSGTSKRVATIGTQGLRQGVSSDGADFFVGNLNSISFVPSTCTPQTSSIAVNLGQVALNNVSGFGSAVGTTSAAKDFNIGLNCDVTAAGAFGVFLQLDGTTVGAYVNQGVLALSSGTATGLGIQVLKGASSGTQTPVTFGTPWKVGAYPLESSALTVPFSARYYQTAAKITPGTANGVATFTVSYQ